MEWKQQLEEGGFVSFLFFVFFLLFKGRTWTKKITLGFYQHHSSPWCVAEEQWLVQTYRNYHCCYDTRSRYCCCSHHLHKSKTMTVVDGYESPVCPDQPAAWSWSYTHSSVSSDVAVIAADIAGSVAAGTGNPGSQMWADVGLKRERPASSSQNDSKPPFLGLLFSQPPQEC